MKHMRGEDSSVERICKLKERLIGMVEHELDTNAKDVDAHELGEVVDMIKDLAQAESSVREAEYHQSVTDAMDEYSDGPMGYRGRDSRGRFVSRPGRGGSAGRRSGRRGYEPSDGDGDGMAGEGRDGGSRGYRPGDPDMRMANWPDRDEDYDPHHGMAFNEWRKHRRYYTETKSDSERMKMREKENEHMAETMSTLREMWDGAEPDTKKRMKADLTKLVSEMNV